MYNILLIEMPKNILADCRLSQHGNHIFNLEPEVIEWCKENKIRYKKIGSKIYYEGLSFYTAESVMAFKLRWLNNGATVKTYGMGSHHHPYYDC